MLNKNKFYLGMSFIVQAFSFAALFMVLCKKKRSIANAFLTVAAMGGIAGMALLYLDSKDELKRRKITAARDACCADDIDGECEWEELYTIDGAEAAE